jgi:peptidyl-prolyl cis-trans isomerase A (cyclophilin A)
MRWFISVGLALAISGCGDSASDESTKGTDRVGGFISNDAEEQAEAQPSLQALGPIDLMSPASAVHVAPEKFQVSVETTDGTFLIDIHREWAPNGADRFYNLVEGGYYTDVAFFRAIKGFMVQYGISGDPVLNQVWKSARIDDDPTGVQSNTRGRVTFATSGPNSRTTQMFINYGDNVNLDNMGFSPIGEVVEGMDVVDRLHTGYGEGAPRGKGPSQPMIQSQGNAYLRSQFPDLDFIVKMSVVTP